MILLRRLALATTIAVFVLIAVGALVRAAGAGLGCPDWPTCFGLLVPPTDAAQLPAGFDRASFNVQKTWIEYLNRLTGAVIGLLSLGTALAAFLQKGTSLRLRSTFGAVLGLILVQAWLGAKVVEMKLDPRFVTVHLVLAIAIFGLLIWGCFLAYASHFEKLHLPVAPARMRGLRLAWLAIGLVSFQIVLGALVRGSIDEIAAARPDASRQSWIDAVGTIDQLHRKFAIVVVIAVLLASWRALQIPQPVARALTRCARLAAALVLAQVAVGVGLAYAGLPRVLQVGHIVLASALWGVLLMQILLTTRLDRSPDQPPVSPA